MVTDDPSLVFREERIVLKKALHIGLLFKAPGSETLQRFLDHGGNRFIAHHYLAAPRDAFVTIADRCLQNPIAIQDTRTHAALGLLRIMLALILIDAGNDVLNELIGCVILKIHYWTFKNAAGVFDLLPHHEVAQHIAAKPVRVIDNDDDAGMLSDICQHCLKARAIGVRARQGIGENFPDLITFSLRIFPASALLRVQSIASHSGLFYVGHTAIKYRAF
ncbi:MAG: hypothetical protein VYB05_03160 [Pseudomonadota bacterium]|nr:hypothetical protein [Pseudomonadota bacterium]